MRSSFLWSKPGSFVVAREGLARALALLVVALTVGLFAFDVLSGVPLDADSFLGLGLGLVALVSWGLLKTRHYALVVWLFVATLMVQAAASTYFFGSVRTMNVWLIVIAQVAAGIFLSRRALVGISVVAILWLGLLTWADGEGLLAGPPVFLAGWRTWLTQTACLLAVAAMVYLNRVQMRTAQQMQMQEAHQRLQAQMERDHGKERFSRVFFSSPTPIFVQAGRTGHILDVNPAFEQLMRYPREEVLNRRDAFLWVHDAAFEVFALSRRTQWRTGWHPITAVCPEGQQIALLICSERDEEPEDSLVITALRLQAEMQGCGVHRAQAPGRSPSEGERSNHV